VDAEFCSNVVLLIVARSSVYSPAPYWAVLPESESPDSETVDWL
jgi:hypothetical protein